MSVTFSPDEFPPYAKRVTLTLFVVVGATSMFTRVTDPLIAQIATELAIDPNTAALLGTAFALPYAVVQPIFGAVADRFGKTRVLVPCMAILVLAAAIGAIAKDFTFVLTSRVVSGIAAGGVFPVSIAMVSDLFPVKQRVKALSGLLGASTAATLLGAIGAGFVGDSFGWRGVFVASGLIGLAALLATPLGFRGVALPKPNDIGIAGMALNYWGIVRHPLAKICYAAVLLEGALIYGYFPHISPQLEAIGEPRATIAGVVLSGFAVGGLIVSTSVATLLTRFGDKKLMIGGGGLVGLALFSLGLAPPWQVQTAAFVILGTGFFTLHTCIQIYASELAPHARGSAMALHATAYFLGQAIGPPLYSWGLIHLSLLPMMAVFGLAALGVGIVCAATLRFRPRD